MGPHTSTCTCTCEQIEYGTGISLCRLWGLLDDRLVRTNYFDEEKLDVLAHFLELTIINVRVCACVRAVRACRALRCVHALRCVALPLS